MTEYKIHVTNGLKYTIKADGFDPLKNNMCGFYRNKGYQGAEKKYFIIFSIYNIINIDINEEST